MGWQTTQLGSPMVKGFGKVCMGVAICGIVYFLDSAGALSPSFELNETAKMVKYAAYTGGVITVLGGLSKIMNGE